MNSLSTQQKANGEESKDQILDISQESNEDILKQGLGSFFGDIELETNPNLQHLLKATSHLKRAQDEFELAKREMERQGKAIFSPEILRS